LDPDIDSGVRTDIESVLCAFPQISEPNNEFMLPINDTFVVASSKLTLPQIIDMEIKDEDNNSLDFRGGNVTIQLHLY
jgi:hypothetical protein